MTDRPTGVQIRHADGTRTFCELSDAGIDEHGMHNWWVLTPVDFRSGDHLYAESIPGRSAIIFETNEGDE